MRSTTDHGNEGRDQTAEALNHATVQVADTIMDAAHLAGHMMQDAGQTRKDTAEEPRTPPSRRSHGWRRPSSKGKEPASMQNRHNARPRGDDGPPTWRPQPGEILAGMIDRYSVSDTSQGPVRTVMVIEERTGERIRLLLASTSLLSLFAQSQPHPGERIDVRFRWHAPNQAYQRWRLLVDRPAPPDLSPLGGEVSDEAPWHWERRVAIAVAGSTQPLREAV